MTGGWIYDENVRLFVEALSHFSGAPFDENDWTGLEHELITRPDQLDVERRVTRVLGKATLDLMYEPGSSVVSFELVGDKTLELRARTLEYVLTQVVVHPDG